MSARNPITTLATHEVANQPPPLGDVDLFETDAALKEALHREGAGWAEDKMRKLGALAGSRPVMELGCEANRQVPELHAFDRFGQRIDEVAYHPAYHELMRLGIAHEVPSIAWTAARPGGHVAHAALLYLFVQAEAGVCCPFSMAYAAVPTLRLTPEIAAEWEPRITSRTYDPRCIPVTEKAGATIGMAMTEKQGGSDLRANTTRARPLGGGSGGGPSGEFELTGHKWFCSAPMSDAFLTLARTEVGLSCFLVPRWRPDATRNPILIQRLKDKLGNRSNASAEIEYQGTWARLLGEEGRGVSAIIDMVAHTRLDTAVAPAGMMRQALIRVLHHVRHRAAFGHLLADQPLMRNVLADLAIESEAATAMVMRVARGYDAAAGEGKGEGGGDGDARAFSRIAVPVAKYWINKRIAAYLCEAMECLGGSGYVEESVMPRLYREAPVNSIWEGSGNVICLDVLRAMRQAPDSLAAFLAELGQARGGDRRFDAALDRLEAMLAGGPIAEADARRLTEAMAVTLEGALLLRFAPTALADAFCASRLEAGATHSFGTLPAGVATADILARAWPDFG